MRRHYGKAFHLTVSTKSLAYRFSAILLLTFSATLVVLDRADHYFAERMRRSATDIVAPMLEIAAAPFDSAAGFGNWVGEMVHLREENLRLRGENMKLLQWQQAALELQSENKSLRELARYAPVATPSFITARIVTDTGGPYVRSALINAGEAQGVKKYAAAVNEHGLVGRIVDVNRNSARLLLVTDMNSRIPVMTESSRLRSMLAGGNADKATLTYLPPASDVAVGERVLTSGDGATLPAGIPVGVVSRVENGTVEVTPLIDEYRLEYLNILDVPGVQ